MSTRSRIASITSIVAALVLLGGTATAAAPQLEAASSAGPQKEIDAYLHAHPGGAQVSDNAVAYRDGEVVVVFPDRGELRAPEGLGANVRSTALAAKVAEDVGLAAASYAGCPSGTLDRWYCFYTDSNYGGRRLQFLNTCADYAADWGFNNSTSSWVNTNPNSRIVAWDYRGGEALWVEGYGLSYDNWVGSADNDRMSYWTRTNC
ncbi:MAG TPA: peptidase inhibitor family I36 protein [Intrasporangium sp.]|uniref:peptidase inhibitor family I36 protein n=1 Tax=Intrasporangium sp. TaxID=1925024 RepID=UPI002F9393CF